MYAINNLLSNNFYYNLVVKIFLFSSFVCKLIICYYFISDFFIFEKEYKANEAPEFGLLVGKDSENNKVFIPEKGLYQNVLVTGSIGSGKTSSAMYPFTKQLINYKSNSDTRKLSFLILDVKGNYYRKVLEFANSSGRLSDVIVIGFGSPYKYNPLDKPDLKSSILANRVKEILLLFSPNNSESYWLDKVEQVVECCINLCRIYNNGYVTFEEIHNLVTDKQYFYDKINETRKIFVSGKLSHEKTYLLYHSISFLESDYYSLDERTHNLIMSEITRITNNFVADYEVHNIFCPSKEEENFYGFDEALATGKIVVLNMNIAKYKNLSKIIAAYLKLDYQTDILKQLANVPNEEIRPSVFISDEYQEYVTSSDANFFSQSREAKCINIVSTQSYTSLLNTLGNKNSTEVIIQNLVNKIWFRTDDIFTIEDVQKQIGKEEKAHVSKTISENSKESFYNPLFRNFTSLNSNISESVNSYTQKDFVYDYNFFTQKLESFTTVAFLSNGTSIMKPQELKMLPYFADEDYNK